MAGKAEAGWLIEILRHFSPQDRSAILQWVDDTRPSFEPEPHEVGTEWVDAVLDAFGWGSDDEEDGE